MVNQSYSQIKERLKKELQSDPGINKLAYPAQIYWTTISEDEVISTWDKQEGSIVLYIHIPFCTTKCNFCGFYTQSDSKERRSKYVSALEREIELYERKLNLRKLPIEAFSIGGGTPSQLTIEEFEILFSTLTETFATQYVKDVQVEMAPDEYVTEEKLRLLKEKGVNRISLGIETWNDELKRDSNRPKSDTVKENHRVCKLVKDFGFDFNIDLLYGLPEQTKDDSEESIRISLEYNPDQISFYAVSLKPNQRFFRNPVAHKSLQKKLEMYESGRKILREAGYEQQTRNNFVRNNNTCIYEVRFAQGIQTLGLGTTSVSFVDGLVYRNGKLQESYLQKVQNDKLPVHTAYRYNSEEQINAFIIKNLEWLKVDRIEFRNKFGIDITQSHHEVIDALHDEGLIEINEDELRVTDRGIFFVTAIKRCFYDEEYIRKREEYYKHQHEKNYRIKTSTPSGRGIEYKCSL